MLTTELKTVCRGSSHIERPCIEIATTPDIHEAILLWLQQAPFDVQESKPMAGLGWVRVFARERSAEEMLDELDGEDVNWLHRRHEFKSTPSHGSCGRCGLKKESEIHRIE